MPKAAIDAQNVRIWRAGRHFTRGNAAIDAIMAALTPPVASPSCGDLQTSDGLIAGSPFPNPGGGPAPTVEIMNRQQLAAWYNSWSASSAAAAKNANYGSIPMPIVGGPSAGISRLPRGVRPASRGRWSAPGVAAQCQDPEVLPVDTVARPADGSGPQNAASEPASAMQPWQWLALAALAGFGLYQVSTQK
jgi:hypothetical protein